MKLRLIHKFCRALSQGKGHLGKFWRRSQGPWLNFYGRKKPNMLDELRTAISPKFAAIDSVLDMARPTSFHSDSTEKTNFRCQTRQELNLAIPCMDCVHRKVVVASHNVAKNVPLSGRKTRDEIREARLKLRKVKRKGKRDDRSIRLEYPQGHS